MLQINETAVLEAPVAAPAATPEPKAPAPKAAKAVAKPSANGKPKAKPAAKAPAKATPKQTAPVKDKLSNTQAKILKVLAKAGSGLTRRQISDKVGTFIGTSALGQSEAEKVVSTSLLGRGYVRFGNNEDVNGIVFEITAAGRKRLEKGV